MTKEELEAELQTERRLTKLLSKAIDRIQAGTVIEELRKPLQAIVDGYPITVYENLILVENPQYQPDNGSDPYLIIDVAKIYTKPTKSDLEC